MTKEDMILELIKEVRDNQAIMSQDVAVLKHISKSVEDMRTDVAILKSKHDTGNRSDRIVAGTSILAILLSVAVFAVSCKGCTDDRNKSNGRRSSSVPLNIKHGSK